MSDEIALDLFPIIRLYKDGRVERLWGTEVVPPGDPKAIVQSKDVLYSPEANLSARLYLPAKTNPGQKLPLLVYFHGGAFCVETAFSPTYHNYLNTLVAEANVIAISVDYRSAPEHPLPAAYDDSWTAIKWASLHIDGNGPEEWLNSHADFGKVFFAGDSAGANISHQLCLRHGQEKLVGIHIEGIVLVHPYFWGSERIGNESKAPEYVDTIKGLWYLACPTTSGLDDPLFNPVLDPNFASLECARVLVVLAGKDLLRDRGWHYYEQLRNRGWEGKIEIIEMKEENHIFHLISPGAENARTMLQNIVSFLNHEQTKL